MNAFHPLTRGGWHAPKTLPEYQWIGDYKFIPGFGLKLAIYKEQLRDTMDALHILDPNLAQKAKAALDQLRWTSN
jgi:hypothetical protein